MKNVRKASPSKIVRNIDMELKALLLADLNAFKTNYTSIRKVSGSDYPTAA